MLLEFNTVSPKLMFMLELEKNYKIMFLDITIKKLQNSIQTAVY